MSPDLRTWLDGIGLGRYASVFEANDVDLAVLSHLSDEDLRELGLSLGHRRKLQAALSHLKERAAEATAPLSPDQPAQAERKLATVLFADVCESTALIGQMDVEHAADVLETAVRIMTDAVHRYDGTVNKVQGDGIMAIFGAPRAYEDHATRACYAAHEIREAIVARPELDIQVRVGLNSGEVLVRGVQVDLTHEYDAIGPAVHVAGRMEQLAGPGEVYISETTAQLAAGTIEVESRGALEVRGFESGVAVYRLISARGNWSRWALRSSRELTPFVGRKDELARLRRCAERAAQSEGQVISLVAEAGVGKSRLLYELHQMLRTQGWQVWTTDTSPIIRSSPYLPVARLLRRLFRIREDDDPVRVKALLRRGLAELGGNLLSHIPALLFLLDVTEADEAWAEFDGHERQKRIAKALRECLLVWSRKHRTAIFLEDLQWADGETLGVVDAMVNAIAAARVLLILTHRPDFTPTWPSQAHCCAVQLQRLGDSDAEEMLTALLGRDPSMEALAPRLLKRSEGRPLFIEETVHALIEKGVIAAQADGYRLVADSEEIAIPTTVQAVIAQRIDVLPADRKQLLQTASVIGRSFPRKLLQALGGWETGALKQLLVELEAQEFLFRSEVFPEPVYSFKHVLTQDVAYGSLPRATRKALHARLIGLIESTDYYRREDRLERLAHHAFAAELWWDAVGYLEKAAQRAFDQSAHKESVELLDRALLALSQLSETRETLDAAVDLHMRMRAAHGALGRLAENRSQLAEAKRLAERSQDRGQLARIAAHECILDYLHGDIRDAIAAGERAVELSAAANEPGIQLMANLFLGVSFRFRGDSGRSSAVLRRYLEQCLEEPEKRHGAAGTTSVLYLANLAQSTANQGQFEESEALARKALDIAHHLGRPFDVGISERVCGHGLLMRGEMDEAIPYLERGLQAVTDADIQVFIPYNASFLAYAYGMTGRLDEALVLLDRALESLMHQEYTSYLAFPQVYRARFLLLAGKVPEARKAANKALKFARDGGYLSAEALGLCVSGEVLAETGNFGGAEARFNQAIDKMGALDFQPGLARALDCMARLQARIGDAQKAEDFSGRSSALWHDMGVASATK